MKEQSRIDRSSKMKIERQEIQRILGWVFKEVLTTNQTLFAGGWGRGGGQQTPEGIDYANEGKEIAQSHVNTDSDLWLWFSVSNLMIRVEGLSSPIASITLI